MIEISEGRVLVTLPIKTVSEANCFEPWRKKHVRHKRQKETIRIVLSSLKDKIKLPCTITITRIASRMLDEHDNLRFSVKYCLDAAADFLIPGLKPGRADGDKRLTFQYAQKKGKPKEYAVSLLFEFDS